MRNGQLAFINTSGKKRKVFRMPFATGTKKQFHRTEHTTSRAKPSCPIPKLS